MSSYFLVVFIILLSGYNEASNFNNGFESVNEAKTFPTGWSFQRPNYNTIKLDTGIKYEGKYSLSIENSIEYNTPQEIGNYFSIDDDDKSSEDGGSIELRGLKRIPQKEAQLDTSYRNGSRIKEVQINASTITNLAIVGQFWGFLKYHHPYVTSGDVNWDAQLFEILAKTLKCKNLNELNSTLETYIDCLPKIKKCDDCNLPSSSKVVMAPNYGDLFTGKFLTKSLTSKLRYIQQNRSSKQNYWVKKDPDIGYPLFTNEKSYEEMVFPDAGYRLLTLFRYWSIINYYSPYRNITQYDWNQALKIFIPQFIAAKNSKEYTLATLRLIAVIKDTHANIFDNNPTLESIKGMYRAPFHSDFVENKLIVTGYRTDTLNLQDKIKIGDIIVSINGDKIGKLIKKYLPITPASNYDTQLRDLPWTLLMRNNEKEMRLIINRNGKMINLNVPMIGRKSTYRDSWQTEKEAYYLISDQIGYVNAGKYQNSDLPAIKKMFSKTTGIIVDIREYPSDFMPYTFVNYIKPSKSLFAKFSMIDYSTPGSFILADSAYNGSDKISDSYKGKVVVIVNAETQSQGEFTTMAFQSSPNVKVIGSQTAGADGNVTAITLPGGIFTFYSSIGIFYPDNSPTQRVGVKIDYIVKPTIKGIIGRKDELMQKAIYMLNSH